MAVVGAPLLSDAERAALEHDYRYSPDRLVRQRSQIILLCTELETQSEVARVVYCSADTVREALTRYHAGGRTALRRQHPQTPHASHRTLGWQKALATAMEEGPQAGGLPRPTWTAPLLARHLAQATGIETSERTVRRGLDSLGYRLGRPTWSVRAKAEAEPDYLPKRPGSKRS
jgi:transposase